MEEAIDKLKFEFDYLKDDEKRKALFSFLGKVFNRDLDQFEEGKFWDYNLSPMSYFNQEGAVVASLMFYELPLNMGLSEVKTAGLQAVGTLPEYRNMGLANELIQASVDQLKIKDYDLILLFTDKPGLFEKYGFRVVPQYFFHYVNTSIEAATQNGLQKINANSKNDIAFIKKQFINREPVSDVLGMGDVNAIFIFNELKHQYNRLYYIPKLEVVVSMEIEDNVLKLYDIVGNKIPSLDEILRVIDKKIDRVELYFYPDKMKIRYKSQIYLYKYVLMAKGYFPAEKQASLFIPSTYF